MFENTRDLRYGDYSSGVAVGEQPAVLGKVLGLLGFAFLFTLLGAVIGRSLGPGGFLLSIVGSLGTLIALQFLREKSPLNLGLLYAFATFEGMALGLILDMYIARGMGGILTVGLIGVIVASLVGIFIQLPLLYIGISAVATLLFTGFLVFDLNRVAQSRGATEGQVILLAVSVYLDIFNLFLALLRLFGIAGSRDD
jgi:FtsH-binding integral membrane protein